MSLSKGIPITISS